MWVSEKHRNEAIRTMLSGTPSAAKLWTPFGPSEQAMTLLDAGGGYLSSGERVLLRAAFDLWNGSGKCRVSELLDTLDEERLHAVADALLARDRREGPWFGTVEGR